MVNTLLKAQVHTSWEATHLNVSSECLQFRLVFLVWVHWSLQGVYCVLYFSNNPTEKSYVLLGPVNLETMTRNRNEKAYAAETNGEARNNIKLP
jgi:hypothetical protein